MVATVCCAVKLVTVTDWLPVTLMLIVTLVVTKDDVAPSSSASARTLVMRRKRVVKVPGGSNGTPAKTMLLETPLATEAAVRPWKMFGRPQPIPEQATSPPAV